MPVIKSAIKKARQDIKRREANRQQKEKLKELIKIARNQPTEKTVRAAISFIDKAAQNNLIHKNKAARFKSKAAKFLSKSGSREKTSKTSTSAPKKKTKSAAKKRASSKKSS